jgi:hypothetical protein
VAYEVTRGNLISVIRGVCIGLGDGYYWKQGMHRWRIGVSGLMSLAGVHDFFGLWVNGQAGRFWYSLSAVITGASFCARGASDLYVGL